LINLVAKMSVPMAKDHLSLIDTQCRSLPLTFEKCFPYNSHLTLTQLSSQFVWVSYVRGKWSKHSQYTTMTQHQGTLKWGPHIGSHLNVPLCHCCAQRVQGSLSYVRPTCMRPTQCERVVWELGERGCERIISLDCAQRVQGLLSYVRPTCMRPTQCETVVWELGERGCERIISLDISR
jgi:hypothetical protein